MGGRAELDTQILSWVGWRLGIQKICVQFCIISQDQNRSTSKQPVNVVGQNKTTTIRVILFRGFLEEAKLQNWRGKSKTFETKLSKTTNQLPRSKVRNQNVSKWEILCLSTKSFFLSSETICVKWSKQKKQFCPFRKKQIEPVMRLSCSTSAESTTRTTNKTATKRCAACGTYRWGCSETSLTLRPIYVNLGVSWWETSLDTSRDALVGYGLSLLQDRELMVPSSAINHFANCSFGWLHGKCKVINTVIIWYATAEVLWQQRSNAGESCPMTTVQNTVERFRLVLFLFTDRE